MKNEYDLVIIGGGSAGLTAAAYAIQFGAKVAIVEKHRIGGDCTWTGCIPSKALLKVAKVAHEMRTARRYGLTSIEPQIDLKAVLTHIRSVIGEVYDQESPESLATDGITIYLGEAHFHDAHTITVGDAYLTCGYILISTGAQPIIPPISGLREVNFLTYEHIWDMENLPSHLIVLGAGPIGCEMAQAFRRLGSKVTLMESGERLLPRDDPAASHILSQVFSEEGIDLQTMILVRSVWQDGEGIHLQTGDKEFIGDSLLVAVGRRPNVNGLDLEKGGVVYDSSGIHVDEHLRTNQNHIYAAGDCTGGYQFTHYAGWQAFVAVRNALLPGATKGVISQVPWTTFTDPEIAHAGLTEDRAREQLGGTILTCDWPMARVDRALAEDDRAGFIKLVHKKDGTLLGATIAAGRAGEMIHEWIIAMEQGLKIGDIANTLHVYPTYSVANMQAAAAIRAEQLLSGTIGRVIRKLARVMR